MFITSQNDIRPRLTSLHIAVKNIYSFDVLINVSMGLLLVDQRCAIRKVKVNGV